MQTTITEPAQLDADVIAAIKSGDRERYRELIERHEQKVYAVAWCRLGDADLAEEATQETFIKAYARLDFLGQGNKFAAWVMAIARNTAINLGLRRRNELKKRERWALEQDAAESTQPDGDDEQGVSTQTLRETLAELPPLHRECLVLFYLEGKSGEEAAALLGINENAFKVRLHRARGALRARLESRLEESLTQLRPRHALAPAIMGFIASRPAEAAAATSAAGMLAKISAGATKLLPFSFLTFGMWLLGLIPSVILSMVAAEAERRNFRDKDGFRARLHKQVSSRMIIFMAILMAVIYTASPALSKAWGPHAFARVFGLIAVPTLLIQLRRLRINRSRFFILLLINQVVAIAVLLAQSYNSPFSDSRVFLGALMVLGYFSFRYYPAKRMDHSLFLRHSQGLLPEPATTDSIERRFTRDEIFAFGRFLGDHWLISDYRNIKEGVQFHLARVRGFLSMSVYQPFWSKTSRINIMFDGTVAATLSARDEEDLAKIAPIKTLGKAELEEGVATAVREAMHAYSLGHVQAAERCLGEEPEQLIFKQPPERTAVVRWRKIFMLLTAIFAIVMVWRSHHIVQQIPSAEQKLAIAKKDLAAATNVYQRCYALGRAAKLSFVAGQTAEAHDYAQQLLSLSATFKQPEGDAIHDGNMVLGRVALKQGRIEEAKERLLQAGKTPGSPVLDTFGPNMSLAKDLLEKGERDTVLHYFDLCRKFWTLHPETLDKWTKDVKRGRIPDFGANELY